MKIKKELCQMDKTSYAMDVIDFQENSIDCSEGCNPYGCPDYVFDVLDSFDKKRFSTYPHSQKAKEGIIKYWSDTYPLELDNIVLADSSISAIYLVNNIFAERGAKVLGIAPQFSDYVSNVKLLGMNYTSIKLQNSEKYKIPVEKILDAMTSEHSVVYLDNPNNPTGQVVSLKQIHKIVQRGKELGVAVIIDEAYGDFISNQESAISLLHKYPNLIVLRTLSKGFGLAGLRAGYILAAKETTAYLQKMTNPYVVGELTREMIGCVLINGNEIEQHTKIFASQKKQLLAMPEHNISIAHTDLRVPIFLVTHKDSTLDMVKELSKYGIISVPGKEFDELARNSARLRLPVSQQFPRLLDALKKINA